MRYRCYYKDNGDGLQQIKDFDDREELIIFFDSKNRRGYIVLLIDK